MNAHDYTYRTVQKLGNCINTSNHSLRLSSFFVPIKRITPDLHTCIMCKNKEVQWDMHLIEYQYLQVVIPPVEFYL